MVNLEWYRSFIAVYRVGTVSGAADSLHLTQPAVSQHVAALESSLNTTLFERTPRRMVPTATGVRLYNQIAESIERLETVSSGRFSSNAPELLRLGAPQEFFMEKILKSLPKNSNTNYIVKFGLAQNLISDLLTGNLDLVVSTVKFQQYDLIYHPIFEESFWLVGAKYIDLPKLENLSIENLLILEKWLLKQPIISYSEELPIIRRFWRVVFGKRIDVNPTIIIPDLRGIREAVELGLGISILPNYLCENFIKQNRLQLIINPTPVVTNKIWLVFRKSEIKFQKHALFLELSRLT